MLFAYSADAEKLSEAQRKRLFSLSRTLVADRRWLSRPFLVHKCMLAAQENRRRGISVSNSIGGEWLLVLAGDSNFSRARKTILSSPNGAWAVFSPKKISLAGLKRINLKSGALCVGGLREKRMLEASAVSLLSR